MDAGILVLLVIAALALFAVVLGERTVRRKTLATFAGSLQNGEAGDRWARGSLAGRGVELRLERAHGRRQQVLELGVRDPAVELELAPEGLLDALGRLAGRSEPIPPGVPEGVVVRQGQAQARRLLQEEEAAPLLRELLQRGQRLTVRGGRLRLTRTPPWLSPEYLARTLALLRSLVALLDRRRLDVKVKGETAVFGWTGEGQAIRCPFCRDDLEPEGPAATACPDCGTLHHAACLEEAGGCTVFACRGGPRPRPRVVRL